MPPPPTPDRSAHAQSRSWRSFTRERLRASPLLRATMVVALLCYGGIPVLVIWQENGVSRLDFATAGTLVAMSLASWSLLFWWYPVLARTADHLGEARGEGINRALETVAITCVVIVHALLAFIILHRAGGG